MLTVPTDSAIDTSSFLVNGAAINDDGLGNDSGNDESDHSDDEADHSSSVEKKRKSNTSIGKKAGLLGKSAPTKKKHKKLSRTEQLRDLDSYQKAFSKAWLSLLSLSQLSLAQHKIILRHLPDNVMPHLFRPLTLADYLSQCFTLGGVVAVLSLESLFTLIVEYNLDYPDFFLSLYRLCTVEVFSAKYRGEYAEATCACSALCTLYGHNDLMLLTLLCCVTTTTTSIHLHLLPVSPR